MAPPRASLLAILTAFCTFPLSGSAAIVTIYWEGTITSVTEFTQGAAPAGVANGSPIRGSAVFETTQFTSRSELLGNFSFGSIYRFGDPLLITFIVGPSEWRVRGGEVGLLDYSTGPQHSIHAGSSSTMGRAELFPKQVGPFEAGFILLDNVVPLRLFDVPELEDATIDPLQATKGSGTLTSRRFEGNDIVDGYYISFQINQASPNPIPEPSSLGFIAAGLCFAAVARMRRGSAAWG